jgi:hypothetical protein
MPPLLASLSPNRERCSREGKALHLDAPLLASLSTVRGAAGKIKHLTEMLLFMPLSLSRP